MPGVTDLHPRLALVNHRESRLSNSGNNISKHSGLNIGTEAGCLPPEFETVKLKIWADPEYVGKLPYIRVQNPQYAVRILVNKPPVSGAGK